MYNNYLKSAHSDAAIALDSELPKAHLARAFTLLHHDREFLEARRELASPEFRGGSVWAPGRRGDAHLIGCDRRVPRGV